PAREHLHDPLDLLLPTDHRVELLLARELREVASELVQHHRALSLTARLAGRLLLATGVPGEQLDDGLPNAVQVRAELLEDLGGDPLALADEAEQDVLGPDVVVAELEGLAKRELQDLLGPRRERDVAGRSGLTLPDDLLDLLADGLEGDVQRLERLGGDPLALVDEAEQDVLGPDVVVVEHPRLFLGEDHHPPGSVGEAFEHVSVLRAQARLPFPSRINGPRPTPKAPPGASAAPFAPPKRPRRPVYPDPLLRPGVRSGLLSGTASHVWLFGSRGPRDEDHPRDRAPSPVRTTQVPPNGPLSERGTIRQDGPTEAHRCAFPPSLPR